MDYIGLEALQGPGDAGVRRREPYLRVVRKRNAGDPVDLRPGIAIGATQRGGEDHGLVSHPFEFVEGVT